MSAAVRWPRNGGRPRTNAKFKPGWAGGPGRPKGSAGSCIAAVKTRAPPFTS
jgi:hypothetical protein